MIVALSSIQVEYKGDTIMEACEVSWLRKLLGDIGLHVDKKVVIYCNNLSNIQLAKKVVIYYNNLRSI